MLRCWKCKRVRLEKYMNLSRRQCKARAVCKNIRNRAKRNKNRVQ